MIGATLRHYRRIYRLYGIRPFAIPLTVLLALAVLFDQFAGDYADRQQAAEKLSQQVTMMRTKAAQQTRFEQIIAEGKPDFQKMSGRAFVAADSKQATALLQTQVQKVLAELYAESVALKPSGSEVRGDAGALAVEAVFMGVPQQLVRLPKKLAEQPQMMRLSELQVAVGPADAAEPDRIEVNVRIEAWFLRSDTKPGVGKNANAR